MSKALSEQIADAKDISTVSVDELPKCFRGSFEEKDGRRLYAIWGHSPDDVERKLYFRLCGSKHLYSVGYDQIISLKQAGSCVVEDLGFRDRYELWIHT